MKDRRRFDRWHPIVRFKSDIINKNMEEEADVLDISAVGMRFFFRRALIIGDEVYERFEVPYNTVTFFVRGRVMRVRRSEGMWEVSVKFVKISTSSFSEVYLH